MGPHMAYDIERYLNIRSAHTPSVTHDGDQLAFLLNSTGVPQVWTVAGPQKWPQQRTFFEERVTFVSSSPERNELIFGKDEGGNERAQLFLLDLDTGEIDGLTGMPEAKHRWGGWSHDGDRFAFASNRRDEAVFDIYVQSRTARGDEATMVYEGDGWLSVAGWSPSDDRLIVHEARASFDHDLHVLDLETGSLTSLTDHPDDHRYASPSWGPNGRYIYLVTDEDVDTLELARIDTERGDLETVRTGGDWNVDAVAVDDETGRLVYSRNVDGYTEYTIGTLDEEGDIADERAVDLLEGVAGGVSFFPGGDRFATTAHSREMNPNVYVIDCSDGTRSRWTDASTAGIPREVFRSPEVVHFESFDGREIPALFTLPENPDPGETPVIVDIHGGPESQRRPSFSTVQQYFLDRGYAVFEPNVRGSSGYGRQYTHLDDVENRMDSVADIAAGLDWLEDHEAVDPDRFVAMGGSYGGFMVLASLTEYPDRWAAGIDIVGIANFVTFLENTGDWRRELREAEYGSLDDDREFLESISPINNIERIEAPLFVLHGENDPRVPVGEARQVAQRAEDTGVPVRTLIFDDEGHGFAKLDNRIEAYTAIAEFLDDHV